MRTYVIGLMCICLLALAAGCPQQTETKQPAPGHLTASTPNDTNTTSVTSDAKTPAGEPETAAATEAEETPAPEEPAPDGADTATAADVAGTWLALFGRGDQGVNEQAYNNGHQLQFNPDGTLVLTMIKEGKPGQQMLGTYRIEKGRLEWSYSLVAALGTGALDMAPLGMGRDEEIGLLKGEKEGMGRDDEIGLLKGEKEGMGRDDEVGLAGCKEDGKTKSELHTEDLRVVLDGPFMALTDDHGQIYVYGKAGAVKDQALPDHPWQGEYLGKHVTTKFATADGAVTGKFGDYGGVFRGTPIKGFIVGKVEGASRLSLAVLALEDNGELSGVVLTDPYAKLDPQFDFTATP